MKKSFITLCLASLIMTLGYAQERQKDTFKTKSGKDVTFTCIKHATFQIEYDGRYLYFDPVTGLKPETDYTSMPRPNIIFITHEHADHFDRMALTQLVTTNTIVYSNPAVGRLYRNSRVMENGDSVNAIKNALLFASYKIGYMGTSNGFMTVEQLEQWRSLIWGEKASLIQQ